MAVVAEKTLRRLRFQVGRVWTMRCHAARIPRYLELICVVGQKANFEIAPLHVVLRVDAVGVAAQVGVPPPQAQHLVVKPIANGKEQTRGKLTLIVTLVRKILSKWDVHRTAHSRAVPQDGTLCVMVVPPAQPRLRLHLGQTREAMRQPRADESVCLNRSGCIHVI